jgi:hypothetical protein
MKLIRKFESYSQEREEMCKYLCRCGYSEDELEMCSDEELRLMCKDHEEEDAYNNDDELLGESKKSKKIKGLKEHQETKNYMFFSNLETIKRLVDEMLEMDEHELDNILSEHDWASDHISVAAENIEHVFNFFANHGDPGHENDEYVPGGNWSDEPSHEETEGALANKDFESEMKGIKSFENFKK